MEGYELFFTGGEVTDEKGHQVRTVHLWKIGDENEGWNDLTGAGFYRVINFVLEQMRLRNMGEFVIEACDAKRQRIFEKWAKRIGCRFRELPDWDGDLVKIFTMPGY